jgi:hypothetical protein
MVGEQGKADHQQQGLGDAEQLGWSLVVQKQMGHQMVVEQGEADHQEQGLGDVEQLGQRQGQRQSLLVVGILWLGC